MHEDPDVENLMPPGTYLESITHPEDRSRKIELAVFKEHRFAFYFWNRWTAKLPDKSEPPTLITIDWHRDLAPPSASEKKNLKKLKLSHHDKVAKFIWSGLDTHNDSHLLSAAFLNIIGDVILLKNYGEQIENTYVDNEGNEHRISEFKSYSNFEEAVIAHNAERYFLDIDLDFFVKGKVVSHQLQEVTPYSEQEIAEIVDSGSPLFKHLYANLEGLTIAAEPRYCGGILKSNQLMKIVLEQLFTQDLRWKHSVDKE